MHCCPNYLILRADCHVNRTVTHIAEWPGFCSLAAAQGNRLFEDPQDLKLYK